MEDAAEQSHEAGQTERRAFAVRLDGGAELRDAAGHCSGARTNHWVLRFQTGLSPEVDSAPARLGIIIKLSQLLLCIVCVCVCVCA